MSVTQASVDSDKTLRADLFRVDEIYSDAEFNSRGRVVPIDVVDLAKDIAKRGLQQPVIIRPRRDTDNRCNAKHKYVLIAGHRRHMAYMVNSSELIPAILREGLTPMQELTINAVENLKRSDLNMLQEAQMIEHFVRAGWSGRAIAEELGVNANWVQIREMVLKLDPLIQKEIAAGFLTQEQIRQIYRAPNNQKRFEMVKKVKDARMRGEKVQVLDKKAPKAFSRAARKQTEMQDMLIHLADSLGPSFATRLLAWAAGNVNNYEIYTEIKAEADKRGLPYTMPELEYSY